MSNEVKYGIIETPTIKEFHASRRMFAIVSDELLLAPEGSTLSHADWLETIYGPETIDNIIEECVRGFVSSDGNLFAYTGFNFNIPTDVELLKKFIPALVLQVPNLTGSVYLGMVKGEWTPLKCLGPITEVV